MIKKIFSIFLNIFLKVLPVKPVFRILRKYKFLILILCSICLVGLVFWLRTFSLSEVLNYRKQLFDLIQDKPLVSVIFFFLVYVFVSTISLPGTTVFSISGGFLFGFIKGMLISLFAVSIGSSFAFLITRYFFRDFFLKKRVQNWKKYTII